MVWHVVGFSGGIDSQAAARWVLNREPAETVILCNSDAGGNEHPLTTEFVREYSAKVHLVTVVQPIVADMGKQSPAKIAELGLHPTDPLTFDLLAKLKQRFPSRKAQFCTEHLKLWPQKRWLAERFPEGGYVRYSGVRWEEGGRRRGRKACQWDEFFDCELRCPVIDWTKQMCFDYVKAHGEPINPLYTLGFNRVGCAPCINSGKDDIVNWAQRFPEMITKVREWEARVGRTFFPPCVPGKAINWIDEVVAWAHTTRGGWSQDGRHQFRLDVLNAPAACESRYGLCE